MGKTKIQYADEVSNPLQALDVTTGKKGTHCEKPDPDGTCRGCWAEELNRRGGPDNKRFGTGLEYDKKHRDRIQWIQNEKEMRRLENLNRRKPMSEKFPGNPLVVFTNDTYDLFQPSIPDTLRDWVFFNYNYFTNLNLLIQTTYVSRMSQYLTTRYPAGMPSHLIIGMSAGNQPWFDQNIDHLLAINAQRHYVIAEPMLGSMFVRPFLTHRCNGVYGGNRHGTANKCTVCGEYREGWKKGVDWIIAGGESGSEARPMHPDWPRGLRDDCVAAGAAFLFKQHGEWVPQDHVSKTDFEAFVLAEDEERLHVWDQEIDLVSLRIGKKKAGRLLDGREWNQFPVLDI